MILTKIKHSNFRCFGSDETTIYMNKLTAFLGANSSGKTAALQALLILFGANQREREIHGDDFHNSDIENIDEIEGKKCSSKLFLIFLSWRRLKLSQQLILCF